MSNELILALNPRMHFTRVAIYRMNTPVFLKKINHPVEELNKFKQVSDQAKYRASIIINELKDNDICLDNLKVIIGRGGLIKPVKSGVYAVSEKLKTDLIDAELGVDVVNLGGLIASHIASKISSASAYIAAPVVVDEMDNVARITGLPNIKRKSIFHALNQKTVARNYARTVYGEYEKMNLIVAHLGGGFSIGAHKNGRVVDTNQAYDGDGPFSPIRSGSLPMGDIIRMCYSGEYTKNEMLDLQTGKGGLYAHFKTHSGLEVCQMRDEGNKDAIEVLDAMAYQVAKTICSMYAIFDDEKVDAILITGGMAKDDAFVKAIKRRVEKIAPVCVAPGGDVLNALGFYGTLVLKGETEILEY